MFGWLLACGVKFRFASGAHGGALREFCALEATGSAGGVLLLLVGKVGPEGC